MIQQPTVTLPDGTEVPLQTVSPETVKAGDMLVLFSTVFPQDLPLAEYKQPYAFTVVEINHEEDYIQIKDDEGNIFQASQLPSFLDSLYPINSFLKWREACIEQITNPAGFNALFDTFFTGVK